MSTKTTFKRVALVAVAALGLGVLSVAPSSAAVSALSVVTANGTSTTAANYDSTTAATVTVNALVDNTTTDSVTVTYFAKSRPATADANSGRLRYIDSTTKTVATSTIVDTSTAANNGSIALDSVTAGQSHNTFRLTAGTAGYIGANFRMELDSATTRIAGTYTYTVVVKTASLLSSSYTTNTYDVSIVVSAVASESKVANSGTSTAVLQQGSTFTTGSTQDSAVALVATASATAGAVIGVNLKNASGTTSANESITATITGPGVVGGVVAGTFGKSVVLAHTAGADFLVGVRADGTAGVATITLSTPSVTFASKTVTFYAKSPKTITAAVYNPVLNVGANATAIAATAVDANGINWAGQLSVVASSAADALVGGSATAPVNCAYNAAVATHFCPVTTLTAGTAKFKVVDQSLALGTETAYAAAMTAATSNEVTATVSAAVPATVKLSFDKATYAPFEKALITVTPLDAAGKTLGTKAITNLFATGGITTNVAFGSSSDTLTAVTLTTAAANDTNVTAGAYTYTVYMPAQGDVTISATGGTGLAAAGQVKVTATASIVNSSVDAATDAANEATDAANAATDAALAAADAADAATAAAQDASDAVAALSASVSKLISSLRAQITSLTNLVIKIQKKVRA
jgi:trimeric autotransporter adhesin